MSEWSEFKKDVQDFKAFVKHWQRRFIIFGAIGFGVICLLVAVGASINQSDSTANKAALSSSNSNSGSNTTGSSTGSNDTGSSTGSNTTGSDSTGSSATAVSSPPKVLLSLSGNGIENSAPFLVTKSQLTVTYSYDCSADDDNGNFIADLEYGNQSSINSDDQSIANALGAGATNVTTTIYPEDPGQDYYLAVNSECNWTVTVDE